MRVLRCALFMRHACSAPKAFFVACLRRHVVFVSAYSIRPDRSCGSRAKQFAGLRCLTDDVFQYSPSDLVRAAKQASVRGVQRSEFWDRISARSADLAPVLDFPTIAALLQSFAFAREKRFDLFSVLSDRVVELIEQDVLRKKENLVTFETFDAPNNAFEPNRDLDDDRSPRVSFDHQDILRYIKAASSLRFSDSRVLTFFSTRFHQYIDKLSPTDLADLAISYAALNLRAKDLFYLVSHALPPYVSAFSSYHVAGTLGAFARASLYYEPLVDALCGAALHISFSASHALVFLSNLARLYCHLPAEAHRDDIETVRSLTKDIAESSSHFLLDDWIRIFDALIVLGYYDAQFMTNTLLPSLNSRFEATLLCRNTTKDQASHQISAYIRLNELLMRLPPPLSPSVEALLKKVTESVVHLLLSHETSVVDTRRVIRLLRAICNTKTWTLKTCKPLLHVVLGQINENAQLLESERCVVKKVLDWVNKKERNTLPASTAQENDENAISLRELTSLFYQRYGGEWSSCRPNGEDTAMISSPNDLLQTTPRASRLHHLERGQGTLADTT